MNTQDRVHAGMSDVGEYPVPIGDEPALHGLAQVTQNRQHPLLVTYEGSPLFIAISPRLYEDLLALHGPGKSEGKADISGTHQ